mmetsp:Transcript_16567/g.14465  ORF Transcript_16567/g.14465 Transcript_16567/m.14465 type:complete len:180 (+) Transcript_16567:293-832(+)
MGGRASMRAAMLYPERVKGVMSIDSPASSFANIPGYTEKTYAMVKFFNEFDPSQFKTMDEIEDHMKQTFGDDQDSLTRIMRNFKYDESGENVIWKINTQYFFDNIKEMYYFDPVATYSGPTKMLVGGRSNRWKIDHYRDCFPQIQQSDIIPVPDTGHWIHTDDPESVIKHIEALLIDSE